MVDKLPYAAPKYQTVAIANGASNSDTVDLAKYVLAGIIFPATLTGTAVTIQISQDQSTYNTVSRGGSDISVSFVASKAVLIDTGYQTLEGLGRYLRVVSNGTEGAARSLVLILVPRK